MSEKTYKSPAENLVIGHTRLTWKGGERWLTTYAVRTADQGVDLMQNIQTLDAAQRIARLFETFDLTGTSEEIAERHEKNKAWETTVEKAVEIWLLARP